MISKQMINGNNAENLTAKFFQSKGYWCHIFAKSTSGSQPVDAIALKENSSWLVDVKNVRKEDCSFPISRIEANQLACFDYARNFAKVKNLGIVILFERDSSKLYFLSYDEILSMIKNGSKSVNMSDLKGMEEYI